MGKMINEFKLGMKLLRYGYRVKYNIIIMIIFIVAAFCMEIGSRGQGVIGALYICILGMMAYQMDISLCASEYIQTSPMKKALQTSIPAITCTLCTLVLYTIVVIEKDILCRFLPDEAVMIKLILLAMSVYLIVLPIYTATAYKSFAMSTVGLFILVFLISFATGFLSSEKFIKQVASLWIMKQNVWVISLTGYLSIILGGFIEYGLSCLLYRKELSKFALRGWAKKF